MAMPIYNMAISDQWADIIYKITPYKEMTFHHIWQFVEIHIASLFLLSNTENYIVSIIYLCHLEVMEKNKLWWCFINKWSLIVKCVNNHFLKHPADTGQLFSPTQIVSPCGSGLGNIGSLTLLCWELAEMGSLWITIIHIFDYNMLFD